MMTATEYPHVETDDRGRAFIKGTQFKVIQIVKDVVYFKWPAEEIQRQHPTLTLSQVHNALAHYYDHAEEWHAQLAEEERRDEEFLAAHPPSPLTLRLRKLKQERQSGNL